MIGYENIRLVPMVVYEKQSLLHSLCAVIPAVVARIAPVGSDLYTGSLAHFTYRTIVFDMLGLLFLIHGDLLPISL